MKNIFFIVLIGIYMNSLEANVSEEVKEVKVIAVGEELIPSNPFRFKNLENQYRRTAKLAVDYFRKNYKLSYQPIIRYDFGSNIKDGFTSLTKDALIVTGFLYSDEAHKASLLARNQGLVYLNSVSPLEDIHTSSFIKGLGFRSSQQDQALAAIKNEVKTAGAHNILFFPKTSSVNEVHARNIKANFPIDNEISYIESYSDTKNMRFSAAKVNLFMAGYGFEHIDTIKDLMTRYPNIEFTIIGTHQWSYCSELMNRVLKGLPINAYIVTEFIDYRNSCGSGDNHEDPVKKMQCSFMESYKKNFGEYPEEAIEYSIFDSILISLITLNDPQVKNRNDVLSKFRSFDFHGAAGSYFFRDGLVERSVFLSKWEKGRFVPLKQVSVRS